jgi:hypothetical protein
VTQPSEDGNPASCSSSLQSQAINSLTTWLQTVLNGVASATAIELVEAIRCTTSPSLVSSITGVGAGLPGGPRRGRSGAGARARRPTASALAGARLISSPRAERIRSPRRGTVTCLQLARRRRPARRANPPPAPPPPPPPPGH